MSILKFLYVLILIIEIDEMNAVKSPVHPLLEVLNWLVLCYCFSWRTAVCFVLWQMPQDIVGVALACRGARIMLEVQDLLHQNCSRRCTFCEILKALPPCV